MSKIDKEFDEKFEITKEGAWSTKKIGSFTTNKTPDPKEIKQFIHQTIPPYFYLPNTPYLT